MSIDNTTSTQTLVKSTFYSLFGKILPLFAALFAIPVIIKNIGADRFGLLSIVWILLGYVGLLDLGLGRAITKFVSERVGREAEEKSGELIGTALLFSVGLSIAVSILYLGIVALLLLRYLNLGEISETEARLAFHTLTVGIPFLMVSISLKAVLEAYQKFNITSLVYGFSSIAAYIGVMLISYSTNQLPYIVGYLVAVKALTFALLIYFVYQLLMRLDIAMSYERSFIPYLIKFGSWITVSNVISPIMGYVDRIFIGSFLAMAAVSYYSTSFDLVQKLNVIPTSLVVVLFPAFSTMLISDTLRSKRILTQSYRILQLVMLPLITGLALFAHEILNFWINEEFAQNGALVLQILCIGIYFNNLAQVSFTVIQSANRPDLTAKIHIGEFPLFISLMWYATYAFGLIGAAVVRSVRLFVDHIIMYYYATKLLMLNTTWLVLTIIPGMFLASIPAADIMLQLDFSLKLIAYVALLLLYLAIAWHFILSNDLKSKLIAITDIT